MLRNLVLPALLWAVKRLARSFRSFLFLFRLAFLFWRSALFPVGDSKIVAAPPEKKGNTRRKEKQSFPTFPPFCVALRPPHTASTASSKREKERERVMKSQSDCFFPPSPFPPCQWKKRSKGRRREEVTGGGRRKKRHCDARGESRSLGDKKERGTYSATLSAEATTNFPEPCPLKRVLVFRTAEAPLLSVLGGLPSSGRPNDIR